MKSHDISESSKIPAAHLWLVLAKSYGSIGSYLEHCVSAHGLCLSDFAVLEALLHKGPLTISAIGEKVLLASASMTSAIDRVEKRGFVRRSSSEKDRRVRLVGLTPAGKKLIAKMYEQHAKDLEAIAERLSASERKQLYRGLKKLGLAAKAASAAQLNHPMRKPIHVNETQKGTTSC